MNWGSISAQHPLASEGYRRELRSSGWHLLAASSSEVQFHHYTISQDRTSQSDFSRNPLASFASTERADISEDDSASVSRESTPSIKPLNVGDKIGTQSILGNIEKDSIWHDELGPKKDALLTDFGNLKGQPILPSTTALAEKWLSMNEKFQEISKSESLEAPQNINLNKVTRQEQGKTMCGTPWDQADATYREACEGYDRKSSYRSHSQHLEEEIQRLRDQLEAHYGKTSNQSQPSQALTLYRIVRNDGNVENFLDQPRWLLNPNDNRSLYLRADEQILHLDRYLDQKSNLEFVHYKTYNDESPPYAQIEAALVEGVKPMPVPEAEEIHFRSIEMTEALAKFLDQFSESMVHETVYTPSVWWFAFRSKAIEVIRKLSSKSEKRLTLLYNHFEKEYGKLYNNLEAQLSEGLISPSLVKFLIQPGDILVGHEEGKIVCYKACGRLTLATPESARQDSEVTTKQNYEFEGQTYHFNGSFRLRKDRIVISLPISDKDDPIKIRTLRVYPIEFASKETVAQLERRSLIFWECRKRKLVCCDEAGGLAINTDSDRYMIDHETYKKIHTGRVGLDDKSNESQTLNERFMAQNDPPTGTERFLFPPTVQAFNLRSKKWVDLEVDQIQEVDWNKDAFQALVLPEDTKELVQAVVSGLVSVNRASTDVIRGKGNGLIILLHGAPGTGKTFTAESVAEFAEKPLYRVTCGDIGTKPEKVENYLETVLQLGKIWDCVVLLDEADVFLEERTLTDLQRNALVSVFLRVLEYYDGILILTSNRVGTFDEAFKSRIHLSIHYKSFTSSERFKIWKNFFRRLQNLGEDGIDYENVTDGLHDLAQIDLNGRQIRNAITIARQLAVYQGKTMSLRHVKKVLDVSNDFEKYLQEVRDITDNDMARSNGIR